MIWDDPRATMFCKIRLNGSAGALAVASAAGPRERSADPKTLISPHPTTGLREPCGDLKEHFVNKHGCMDIASLEPVARKAISTLRGEC